MHKVILYQYTSTYAHVSAAGMEHINQRTHLINSNDKIMNCAPR